MNKKSKRKKNIRIISVEKWVEQERKKKVRRKSPVKIPQDPS